MPVDLGWYDLMDPDVRERQAAFARAYGIGGFCYYYYWFEGRRLLEQPLDAVLASGRPDFPFCVFWANEDWKRTWDGGRNEVPRRAAPLGRRRSRVPARPAAGVPGIPRYLRALDQPLLMVYRGESLPDPVRTFDTWRTMAIEAGEMPPYIVTADTSPHGSPLEIGADASVAFPPHRLSSPLLRADPPPGLRPDFAGRLCTDARSVAARAACAPEPEHTHFQTAVPMWDNTPRRQRDGTILVNASPPVFRAWLSDCFARARTMLPPGQRIVFVNAWNEWAEGAYLEPDAAHGRAYLEAALEARYVPADGERIADIVVARPTPKVRRPRPDRRPRGSAPAALPRHGRGEPVVERDARPPAELAQRAAAVEHVVADVERPRLQAADGEARPERPLQRRDDLVDRPPDARSDVERILRAPVAQRREHAGGDVVDVDVVAHRAPVAHHAQRSVGERVGDERGDHALAARTAPSRPSPYALPTRSTTGSTRRSRR